METKERQIGDCAYRVTQFGAKQGLSVLTRLMRFAGPALRAGLNNDAAALGAMLVGLDAVEVLALAEMFAERTKLVRTITTAAGPQPLATPLAGDFDTHFADKYDELVEYLVFAILVNFEKSLGRGKAMGERLREMLAPSASPTTSTGSGSASSAGGGTT